MPKLHADRATVGKYQHLLVADWDRTFADQVLKLLWETLGQASDAGNSPLVQMLDPVRYQYSEPVFAGFLTRIADAGRFVPLFNLPDLPTHYEAKRGAKPTQALQLSLYLTLQANVSLGGSVDYFRDIQSLAFLAAAQFLIPEMSGRWEQEKSILLHSMVLFSLTFVENPSHFYYLVGLLQEALGNPKKRREYLLASFHSTPPADHSYLTKAQEYWMELIDAGQGAEAEDFLVGLYHWCLPSQRDEVREMTKEAFRHISTALRPATSRTRSRTG